MGATVAGWWRRGRHAVSWYVKAVIGESDYDRYVAHLRRHHPAAAVPTVSAYWRARYAEQDANPGARCC